MDENQQNERTFPSPANESKNVIAIPDAPKNRKAPFVIAITVVAVVALTLGVAVGWMLAKESEAPIETEAQTGETFAGETLTDEPETGSNGADSKVMMIPPVSGRIYKKHDPTLQAYSQTLDEYRIHLGVDIATSLGAPVYAVADGTVENIWEDALMGVCVAVEHGNNTVSVYKNLAVELAEGITVGTAVKQGQQMGNVGDTAVEEMADEPHLHFEVFVNDERVDPLEFFSEDVFPEESATEEPATKEPATEESATEEPATDEPETQPAENNSTVTMTLPVTGTVFRGHDPDNMVYFPALDDSRTHMGVDIATSLGTPVYAVADGTVEKIWDDILMGTCISVAHENDIVSVYKNLAVEPVAGISVGAAVKQGQQLGSVGDTALIEMTDEPHLHFEMTENGEQVDPLTFFSDEDREALSGS